jgi:hypothetical protein
MTSVRALTGIHRAISARNKREAIRLRRSLVYLLVVILMQELKF